MDKILMVMAAWFVLSWIVAVPLGRYLGRRQPRAAPRVPEQRSPSD